MSIGHLVISSAVSGQLSWSVPCGQLPVNHPTVQLFTAVHACSDIVHLKLTVARLIVHLSIAENLSV